MPNIRQETNGGCHRADFRDSPECPDGPARGPELLLGVLRSRRRSEMDKASSNKAKDEL